MYWFTLLFVLGGGDSSIKAEISYKKDDEKVVFSFSSPLQVIIILFFFFKYFLHTQLRFHRLESLFFYLPHFIFLEMVTITLVVP